MRLANLRLVVWAAATCGLILAGCGQPPAERAPGPPRLVVSVAPLAGLVRALAPQGAEVTILIPPGRSLHGYEVTPSDVRAVARADVLVYVGAGLEPRIEAFIRDHPSPTRRVVCFADAAGVRGSHEHHDEASHEHHEHDTDPHLWLDPSLVEKLVPAVVAAVKATVPAELASEIDRRAAGVIVRVRDVDQEYQRDLLPLRGVSLVTHHNAFARLADRYGLSIAAVIRATEAAEPTPGEVEAAVRAIRDAGARAVVREPQFNAAAAETIARAAAVPVITLDVEGQEDWFELMRSNLEALRSLGPPKQP